MSVMEIIEEEGTSGSDHIADNMSRACTWKYGIVISLIQKAKTLNVSHDTLR